MSLQGVLPIVCLGFPRLEVAGGGRGQRGRVGPMMRGYSRCGRLMNGCGSRRRIRDERAPSFTDHSVFLTVRQQIYGILADYAG